MKQTSIAKNFSTTPLGRYRSDGEFSGERFREEILIPLLQKEKTVVIEIDGVEGYGSSFLEEAFGGLVRKGIFNSNELSRRLEIRYSDPDFEMYRILIWKYINEAKRENAS